MDILRLKEKSAHKFIQNQLKKGENRKKVVPLRLTNIGIVVEKTQWESQNMIKKLSGLFQLPEPKFKALILAKANDLIENTTQAVVSPADLKMFGKIKNTTANNFLETPFDLMISYISPEPALNRVILLRSQAQIKAGYFNPDFPVYDISIKISEFQMDTFNKELLKYLKIMNFL